MFISVNYGDADRAFETYEGFEVSEHSDDSKKVFNTGDPVKDFRDASEYVAERISETGDRCGMSSSVDHFVSDCGDRYEWYTDENGQEWFDLAEKVEELEAAARAEKVRRHELVVSFLRGIGVPEESAKADAPTILSALMHCSTETVQAVVKRAECPV